MAKNESEINEGKGNELLMISPLTPFTQKRKRKRKGLNSTASFVTGASLSFLRKLPIADAHKKYAVVIEAMNSSKPNPPSGAAGSSSAPTTLAAEGSGKKVRKPYTITKSRESWTEEEHDKFLEALQLFDRDWKKIEDFIGSKTVIQIRSHAQKYFLKVQKNGTSAHVPPPRPKRKAAHPYPQKSPKNVLVPLPATMAYSSSLNHVALGYPTWDNSSVLINAASSEFMPPQDDHDLSGVDDDAGSKGFARVSNSTVGGGVGSSNRMLTTSELTKERKSAILGIPDFAEVYGFIGSVFDPDTKDHVQKLKEMDPINFETVLLLMKNLTFNISGPDFEPVREVISSYDVDTRTVALSAGGVAKNRANVLST